MMEKLGAPQTHLSLKKMIAEVDEDQDGKISFREFLLIFRKAMAGELPADSGLDQLARLTEINVEEVGVGGAKNFFEAKIEQQLKTNKFHDEIKWVGGKGVEEGKVDFIQLKLNCFQARAGGTSPRGGEEGVAKGTISPKSRHIQQLSRFKLYFIVCYDYIVSL